MDIFDGHESAYLKGLRANLMSLANRSRWRTCAVGVSLAFGIAEPK